MGLKRILMSAKGYHGGEFLTTIMVKIVWTNSEFNVGDVSKGFSEFSTLIEGKWGE